MAEVPAQHATCLETTTVADLPNRTYVCGPDCPKPAGPDPARDRRIDVYRDRERRRAARALDRYIEVVVKGDGEDVAAARVAGERLVEACGDYVLARLGHDPSVTQHKSHYGVIRGDSADEQRDAANAAYGDYPFEPHNADDGASGCVHDGPSCDRCRDPHDAPDVMQRARLARGGRGEADAAPGRFERAMVGPLCVHGFVADGQACFEFGCAGPADGPRPA